MDNKFYIGPSSYFENVWKLRIWLLFENNCDVFAGLMHKGIGVLQNVYHLECNVMVVLGPINQSG